MSKAPTGGSATCSTEPPSEVERLTAELKHLREYADLMLHKVLTCGVIAEGLESLNAVYQPGSDWDSPQAQRVRDVVAELAARGPIGVGEAEYLAARCAATEQRGRADRAEAENTQLHAQLRLMAAMTPGDPSTELDKQAILAADLIAHQAATIESITADYTAMSTCLSRISGALVDASTIEVGEFPDLWVGVDALVRERDGLRAALEAATTWRTGEPPDGVNHVLMDDQCMHRVMHRHDAGYGEGLAAGHKRNAPGVRAIVVTIDETASTVTPAERERWYAANGWYAPDDVIRHDIDNGSLGRLDGQG